MTLDGPELRDFML